MQSTTIFALTMAILGQISLCVTILCIRAWRTQTYYPLAAFFVATGVVTMGPAVSVFAPELQTHVVALTLPAYLLLAPMLWLYVEGLTSETQWEFQRRHLRHLLPSGIGLVGAALIFNLPMDARTTIFIEGELAAGQLSLVVVFYVIFLILGWLVQSGYYLVRIFQRLSNYRMRLKDLFASNETRELHWLTWLVLVVGGVWLTSFAALVAENILGRVLIDPLSGAVISLLFVWTLAVWGLRQKPGFAGRYLCDEPELEPGTLNELELDKKYIRSALGAEQAARIARKIEVAMSADALFLDKNLSLHKLSKHISVSPNYISQTLNETVGESFFDYVNKMRINFAKPLIIAGEESVLAISLDAGFNARSSFYKAFKRETGRTPSEFRTAHEIAVAK